jgi:hypothetical protein
MLSKIAIIHRKGGARELVWRGLSAVYRHGLRPLLPKIAPVRYAGVVVEHRRLGDAVSRYLYSPLTIDDLPDYESALVSALRRHVLPGDRVVVIGGGRGVTCVVAAQLSQRAVTCFEGIWLGFAPHNEPQGSTVSRSMSFTRSSAAT